MSILYNSVYVDEKYSSILEPNLFMANVFQPGITFTDKYTLGAAGQIFVHKAGIADVTPGTPGRDFTNANVADTLVQIALNNNFQRSRKIYGVQAASVSFAKGEEELSVAIQEVAQGRTLSGLAALVDGATASANTADLATTNIKNQILADRKTLVDSGATANVLMCGTDAYALLLEIAGSDFVPIANESVISTGRMGQWLGFQVVEANGLSKTSATYYNAAGTLTTVTFSLVDYVMYDADAFSIVTNFENARLIDSETFSGSLAQVEANVGYKVTNAARAIVRKHTAG